jgi:DNA mismatch repair ATPase MutS
MEINDREALNRIFRTSGDIRNTLQKIYSDKLELKILLKMNNRMASTGKLVEIIQDLDQLKVQIEDFGKLINGSKVKALEDVVISMNRLLLSNVPFTNTQIRNDVFIGATDAEIEKDMRQSLDYTIEIMLQLKLIEDKVQSELGSNKST